MAALPGYGSRIYGPIASNDYVEEIVPAGTRCIFDGLLFPGGTQDNARRIVTVQTASGAFLTSYDVNASNQKARRLGTNGSQDDVLSHRGVASSDGLRVLKEEGTPGGICSVLYRTGV